MNKEWAPLAVSRKDSLDSVFLHACRHLQQNQQQPEQQQYFVQLATRYKGSCMRALNEAISAEISTLISDATIITVLMLAFDEVSKNPRCCFFFLLLPVSRMLTANRLCSATWPYLDCTR